MPVFFPPKLAPGDLVRVIAPARSFGLLSEDTVQRAIQILVSLGLKVSFGKHTNSEMDEYRSSPVQGRVEDLHDAFADPEVKGVFSTVGGYNTNQMLDYIDFNLIKNNPKILCGFSDITILHNAILAKTGMVGYYGPHFSSWGIKYGFDYAQEYFKKCCMEESPFEIFASDKRSDDERYLDQEKRTFEVNTGPAVIQEGVTKGSIYGGNLECFCVLMGTPYAPTIPPNTILFLEQDEEGTVSRFDRWLEQILQSDSSQNITGLVLGRFQKKNSITLDQLKKITRSKPKLHNIPIIANVNFGHVMPICTLPLGGTCTISATSHGVQIMILTH